jgi:hypothetical protein
MRHIVVVAVVGACFLACGCAHNTASDPPTTQPLQASADSGSSNPLDAVESGVASIGTSISRLFKGASGDTPAKYAQMMESPSADARREGIGGLMDLDFAHKPPYTTRYAQIAQADSDPLVRATALRALSRSRDKSATDLFVKALGDPNKQVRLEGVKALINVPDKNAIQPLLKLLTRPEEDKDIRIAAADALRHYKTLEVARALVQMLSDRDFGIAYQSRRSLKALTGKDLRYDETAWLNYLTGPEKPLG